MASNGFLELGADWVQGSIRISRRTESGPGALEQLEHELAHAEHVVHVGTADGARTRLDRRRHELLVAPLRVVIRVVLRARNTSYFEIERSYTELICATLIC